MKITKKFMKKYKADIYVLSSILLCIIILIIIIIVMNITRKKKIESFNNFKIKNINNRISKYLAYYRKPGKNIKSEFKYDTELIDNVYLIEQHRNNKSKMDDYTIKSNIGDILFNSEGIWDLNESKFQLVSTAGQGIAIEDIGSNAYFFSIGNIKISFYYKNTTIFGKILIEDGDNKIIVYMKKNKKFINFYTDNNDRIAYSKVETIKVVDNAPLHITKLIITKKYNQYYNIFIIIFIIYLQIFKDQHNTEFL